MRPEGVAVGLRSTRGLPHSDQANDLVEALLAGNNITILGGTGNTIACIDFSRAYQVLPDGKIRNALIFPSLNLIMMEP